MLTVISPAKTLDFESPTLTDEFTIPAHLSQSRKLVRHMRQFSGADLKNLMNVSSNIAELNVERFRRWKTPFNADNARQALFAFRGDVYIGLDAYSMTDSNIQFAQRHLRVLSGLYGLLRPLDLVQAYRLEMGTRVKTELGNNLYEFWDGRITKALNQQLKQSESKLLINLASNEYFKSVKPKALRAQILTPVFRDYNKGKYQIISFFAKKARGAMARYMIDNQITEPEALKDFNWEGYRYEPAMSTANDWIFTRRQ